MAGDMNVQRSGRNDGQSRDTSRREAPGRSGNDGRTDRTPRQDRPQAPAGPQRDFGAERQQQARQFRQDNNVAQQQQAVRQQQINQQQQIGQQPRSEQPRRDYSAAQQQQAARQQQMEQQRQVEQQRTGLQQPRTWQNRSVDQHRIRQDQFPNIGQHGGIQDNNRIDWRQNNRGPGRQGFDPRNNRDRNRIDNNGRFVNRGFERRDGVRGHFDGFRFDPDRRLNNGRRYEQFHPRYDRDHFRYFNERCRNFYDRYSYFARYDNGYWYGYDRFSNNWAQLNPLGYCYGLDGASVPYFAETCIVYDAATGAYYVATPSGPVELDGRNIEDYGNGQGYYHNPNGGGFPVTIVDGSGNYGAMNYAPPGNYNYNPRNYGFGGFYGNRNMGIGGYYNNRHFGIGVTYGNRRW
jgi:hypothetical protein